MRIQNPNVIFKVGCSVLFVITMMICAFICVRVSAGAPRGSESTSGPHLHSQSRQQVNLVQLYDLTALGNLPNRPSCTTTDINALTQVTGECCVDNLDICDCEGFIWEDGQMTPLPVLPGREGTTPLGINNQGLTVGMVWTCGDTNHAFLLEDNIITDLNDLLPPGSGWELTRAEDINDSGQIVGRGLINGQMHGYLLEDGTITDLGTLDGGVSVAHAINNHAQVVGMATTSTGEPHAFLWEAGVLQELNMPDAVPGHSDALGINDQSQIIGTYMPEGSTGLRPFVWEDGSAVTLDSGANLNSMPRSINDDGLIVGWGDRFDAYFYDVAILWRGTRLNDLDKRVLADWRYVPGWAEAINDDGQIVGSSRSADHMFHAFLLTPRGPTGTTGGVSGLGI